MVNFNLLLQMIYNFFSDIRMHSCLSEVQRLVNNQVSETKIKEALLKFNFNTEKALDYILSSDHQEGEISKI